MIELMYKRSILLTISGILSVLPGIVAPVLATMTRDFSNDFMVRIMMATPSIAVVISSPLWGLLGDNFGHRNTFVCGCVIICIFGTIGIWINSITILILTRFVLGIGIAASLVAPTNLIHEYFPKEKVRLLGLQVTSMNIGYIVLLIASGLLALLNWRTIFIMHLIALPFIPAALCVLPQKPQNRKEDLEDQNQNSAGNNNNDNDDDDDGDDDNDDDGDDDNDNDDDGDDDNDNDDDDDNDDVKTVTSLIIILLANTLMIAAFYNGPLQMSFMMKLIYPDTLPLMTSLAMCSFAFTASILSASYGYIIKHVSPSILFTCGFSLEAIGYASIANAHSVSSIILSMALFGIGFGIVLSHITVRVVHLATYIPQHKGPIISCLSSSMFLGQFLSPFLVQPIMDKYGIRFTFVVAAILFGIFALINGFSAWSRYYCVKQPILNDKSIYIQDIVCAFTTVSHGGNPALVIVSDKPCTDTITVGCLIKYLSIPIAAYVTRNDDIDMSLQFIIFNGDEVSMCGHATLAATYALWKKKYICSDSIVNFKTTGGNISSQVLSNGFVTMELPIARVHSCYETSLIDAISLSLNIPSEQLVYIGKSPNHWMHIIELTTENDIITLVPDYQKLCNMFNTHGISGVAVSARAISSLELDYVYRVFSPALGVQEDFVCGSANCMLGPYFAQKIGRTHNIRARCCSKRPGDVNVTVFDTTVKIGGYAVCKTDLLL